MIQKILNFLLNRKPSTGVLIDNRTEIQKEGAYDVREIVASSTPVIWEEKTVWKSYPVKRQFFTSECVAQSTTKHLSINNLLETGFWVELCARFFYWFRINKPHGGMVFTDATRIATKIGACKNERMTQRTRETDPEIEPTKEMIDEAFIYAGASHFEDKERTIDSIARVIQEKGSCLIWAFFDENGKEWWTIDPRVIFNFKSPYDKGTTRHGIIAIDFGLQNGIKKIKVEDSAGNSSAKNNQDRFLDADFISKRVFISWCVIDKPNPKPVDVKPTWTGTRALRVGMSGEDVKVLQMILSFEGCYDYDKFTGWFGGVTKAGVIKLQEKHKDRILTPVGLSKGTGVVGESTLKWLANIY